MTMMFYSFLLIRLSFSCYKYQLFTLSLVAIKRYIVLLTFQQKQNEVRQNIFFYFTRSFTNFKSTGPKFTT